MFGKIPCYLVWLATGLTGCSVMSPAPRISPVEPPTFPVQNLSVKLDHEGNRLPPDFSQVRPGDYCKLESTPKKQDSANESTATDGDSTNVTHLPPRIVAGRVVSIDENNIVLADAISISSDPSKVASAPVTTLLVPRLFKVSGAGRETIAIPGEVTIERASIRDLQPVEGTLWPQIQNSGRWFERVGVDFDFQ